ncbi:MAG: diacylglycerol kinase [Pseudomonadales bacterium]
MQRAINATRHSAQGLGAAWRHETAFRHECIVTLVLLPVAFLLGETLLQTALLIGVCLVVLIVELLNSALEATIDRFSRDHHPLAGRAKDMSSAAVALSLVLVGLVWGLVALQRWIGIS